jgi:hypothetical protein
VTDQLGLVALKGTQETFANHCRVLQILYIVKIAHNSVNDSFGGGRGNGFVYVPLAQFPSLG